MYKELIHIETVFGGIAVSSYSFFLWMAILTVILGMYRRCRAHRMSRRKSTVLTAGMTAAALVGARLMHIVSNIPLYQKYPGAVFAPDARGLSLFGAVLLVCAVGFFLGRRNHKQFLNVADEMVPYIGISIAIARIGCFLNGCCFGVVSNLPWAVRFPLFGEAHLSQISRNQTNLMTSLTVHPTQLYEAFGALLGIAAARWVQHRVKHRGTGMVVFIAVFCLVRFVTHPLRVFPETFAGVAPIFPFIYGGIFLYCIYWVYRKYAGEIRYTP